MMNTVPIRAKHPIKIGGRMVPAGTSGVAHNEPPDAIREAFPNIEMKAGGFVCVEFPGFQPCLVLRKQIIVDS